MPRAYISAETDRQIRSAAKNRCGYCLSPQHLVIARLEIEHIIPLSKDGSNEEANLWLACPICNRFKSDKVKGTDPESGEPVSLFNPRSMVGSEHFRWSRDGLRIIGLAPYSRATVEALHLSDILMCWR